MIKVVRNYWSYEILSSSSYRVSLDIVLKVKDQSFFLLPIEGYKGDLHIKDSAGIKLIFLSDAECKQIGMDMEKLNEAYRQRMKNKLSDKSQQISEGYRIIAVLFDRDDDEFYEKVTISWVGAIEEKDTNKDGPISQCVVMPIHIPTFGSTMESSSSLYFSVKVDSKFVILEEPKFQNLSGRSRVNFHTVLNNSKQKMYRFLETKEAQLIEIKVKIGKPKDVKDWLSLGLFSAVIPPVILLGLFVYTQKIPDFTFPILGSIIAFLIGQKALILQDSSLLKNWNKVIIGASIWVSALMLVLVFSSSVSIESFTRIFKS